MFLYVCSFCKTPHDEEGKNSLRIKVLHDDITKESTCC